MEQSQELAEVISLHRKAAKLSRVQLAELAGVGKTVVYDIEKGKESVQLDTLRKILYTSCRICNSVSVVCSYNCKF